MRRKHQDVRIGQVYQAIDGGTGRSWRVKTVLNLLGIPHARLANTEDEGGMKTLSCHVLTDSSCYRMIEDSPAA